MHQYKKRRDRLRKKLRLAKGESFLVTNIKNIGYLSGFSGSAAWMLVSREHDQIISDTRYSTQLADECGDLEIEIRDASSTTISALARLLKSSKKSLLRYESESLTKSQFDQLESELAGVELVASCGDIECLRSIKDKSEIEAIRKSIGVNQKAFEVIRAQLTAEQTELEIAHNLEHQMRQFGASGFAFEPIIGVGPRSALPHGHPTNKKVGESDFLLFDWGGQRQPLSE